MNPEEIRKTNEFMRKRFYEAVHFRVLNFHSDGTPKTLEVIQPGVEIPITDNPEENRFRTGYLKRTTDAQKKTQIRKSSEKENTTENNNGG